LHETSTLISDIKKRQMPTLSFKQLQFHKAMRSQFHATCQDGIKTGVSNWQNAWAKRTTYTVR